MEVPDSIGTLRHLRYLNLSKTRITQLHENVSNLYNLETLIVSRCYKLTKLPNNFSKLKNLRHLDIRDTPSLNQLPLGIEELKSLQSLPKFIIRGENGHEITKVKDLKNLCGIISIVGLEKVQNAKDALEANISQKRLSELEVVWSDVSGNEMLEEEVLNQLKPNNDYLKQLNIVSYGGIEFPKWVTDPSFQLLKQVSLRGCKKCVSLPPLAQLQSLKELFFEGLDGVKVVSLELLGTESKFSSLEILCFQDMGGWQNWSTNSGVAFPLLQELKIVNCGNLVEITVGELPSLNTLKLHGCPNLVKVSVEALPSLNTLYLYDCPNLVEVSVKALPSLNVLKMIECDSGVLRRVVEIALAVTKLEIVSISGLNDVEWRDAIRYLGAVEKLSIGRCNEIRYLWESEEVASKIFLKLNHLQVSGCANLVRFGEKEEDNCRSNLLTSLRRLSVSECEKMECCWCPDNIEGLSVAYCSKITDLSLPTGEQKLNSLTIWGCEKLLEREWGGQKMNNKSRMLEEVEIIEWRNLKLVTGLNYMVRLTTLRICKCESLESFPDNELPNLTSLRNLTILNCPKMDACRFWPPNLQSLDIGRLKKPISEWSPQNIPTSLSKLSLLCGEDGVSSCSQLSHLLPSSLTSLTISEFEKLESVSMGLQHLISLRQLQIVYCPNLNEVSHLQHLTSLQRLTLMDCPSLKKLSHSQPQPSLQHLYIENCNMAHLPEMMLPSLLSLTIYSEELLKSYNKKGSLWPLISHIPCINFP